ncbi:MAG: A/G-specific adenine glycosylase [Phycisphaerae bacterium]|nr:A/G-specific adenine glycosylase [Phycisphaerae bacterium]
MLGTAAYFSRQLLRWYHVNRRELPWRAVRGQRVDPYHVFISEAMLQQTQVATVIPYFHRFIEKYPTFQSLADADEQSVLRLWQGLGYYSRARNLRKAAQLVACDGLPEDSDRLLALPGVGRYTAGAIASIAFGKRCPILDGNVIRVLCRLDAVRDDPKSPLVRERLWNRAAEILPTRADCGDFNSALMELGATVCTPRAPKCLICPVRDHCSARAEGIQESLPAKSPRKKTPLIERFTFCICHSNRWLIEQRPATGRWAGMWQFITLAENRCPIRVTNTQPLTIIDHALTHRRYRIHAFTAIARKRIDGTWVTLGELDRYPMPKPHVTIARLLITKVEPQMNADKHK